MTLQERIWRRMLWLDELECGMRDGQHVRVLFGGVEYYYRLYLQAVADVMDGRDDS